MFCFFCFFLFLFFLFFIFFFYTAKKLENSLDQHTKNLKTLKNRLINRPTSEKLENDFFLFHFNFLFFVCIFYFFIFYFIFRILSIYISRMLPAGKTRFFTILILVNTPSPPLSHKGSHILHHWQYLQKITRPLAVALAVLGWTPSRESTPVLTSWRKWTAGHTMFPLLLLVHSFTRIQYLWLEQLLFGHHYYLKVWIKEKWRLVSAFFKTDI